MMDANRSTARRFGRVLETHIALPLFALLPLIAIWIATFHFIAAERDAAIAAARDNAREQVDTYEAQMVRSLTAIDQTLKVLKYAVEQHGADGALDALRRQGLLPPSLVFVAGIADRDGRMVASNPPLKPLDISRERYFSVHRDGETTMPAVSRAVATPPSRSRTCISRAASTTPPAASPGLPSSPSIRPTSPAPTNTRAKGNSA